MQIDDGGSPAHRHTLQDPLHRFHVLSTLAVQTDTKNHGMYLANHLIYELKDAFGVFINLSPSAGKALNEEMQEKGFKALPSADDTNTMRDPLLEAFVKVQTRRLSLIAGRLDASAFFDTNPLAGDETTQFMNTYLVNNPKSLLPSYEPGLILSINYDFFKLRGGVISQSGSLYLLGAQLSLRYLYTDIHYFHHPLLEEKGSGLSLAIGEQGNGLFLRLGEVFFSFGGALGKESFELGLGFARGGASVLESYISFRVLDALVATVDFQYVSDVEGVSVFSFRLHYEY